MRAPLLIGVLAIVACGSMKRSAPQTAMTIAPPPPPPKITPPDDAERDWHTFRPPALDGTGGDGRKPLHPVLLGRGCQNGGSIAKDRVLVCGRDVVRIGAEGPELEPFRSADLKGELPTAIWDRGPDEVWLTTKTRDQGYPGDGNPWDYFFVYRGSVHRYHGGGWKSFPTVEPAQKYKNGWLVFDLPRFETPVDRNAPGCADFACARVLPFFWSADVEHAPDFKPLEGKLAWIHPYENEFDWAYFVDANGSVYVVMRALDLATNKRVVGVLSFTEKDGARFEPLAAIPGDSHFEPRLDEQKGGVRFVITTWSPPKTPDATRVETKYFLERDGARWSLKKQPPPKPVKEDPFEHYSIPMAGPEVDGYRVGRGGGLERRTGPGDEDWSYIDGSGGMSGELSKGERGDLEFLIPSFAYYRSIQPPERLVLTDSWGHVHPWPEEAGDDCARPFAVFDAIDEETYDAIIEGARKNGLASVKPWGSLPPKWAHLSLVEMRLFKPTLVVIGASVTPAEAKELREQWQKAKLERWSLVGIGGDRRAHGIYCARPVNPKPFNPPR